MSRIIPTKTNPNTNLPKWMDAEALKAAAAANPMTPPEGLSKIAGLKEKVTVVSYDCPKCAKVILADNTELAKQANLAARADVKFVPSCPDCGDVLNVHAEMRRPLSPEESRSAALYSTQHDMTKEASSTYSTVVDRHVVFKALNALQHFATKNGMGLCQVRYIASEHTKQAGQEYPMLNKIQAQLEWQYGRKQHARVEANIEIDPAGKFRYPMVFVASDGKEYPFNKEGVELMERNAVQMNPVEPKMKNTDQVTFKKPDPTRFHAVSASKEEDKEDEKKDDEKESDNEKMASELVESSKKKVEAANAPTPGVPSPAVPQVQDMGAQTTLAPSQTIVNPMDSKQYSIKQVNPDGGVTVTDPTTGAESVIPHDQTSQVRPVLRTSSFSVEAIANELVKEHLKGDFGDEMKEVGTHMEMIKNDLEEIADDNKLIHQMGAARPHVASMSQRWSDRRKELKTASQVAPAAVDPFTLPPDQQPRQVRAAKSMGYSPEKPNKDVTGHTDHGLPMNEEKEIAIGLTEFPKDQKKEDSNGPAMEGNKGYRIKFDDMDAKQVEEREHFPNETKLPAHRMMREELEGYVKGKDDKNFGLAEVEASAIDKALGVSGQKKKTNRQIVANLSALNVGDIVVCDNQPGFTAGGDGPSDERIEKITQQFDEDSGEKFNVIWLSGGRKFDARDGYPITPPLAYYIRSKTASRVAAEEPKKEPTETPIQYQQMKKAPPDPAYKEPDSIPQASGQTSEAITKLKQVQEEIAKLQEQLQAKQKEFMEGPQKQFQEGLKPENDKLTDLRNKEASYIKMAFTALGETKERVVAYEESIVTALSKVTTKEPNVTLPQVLKRAETISAALAKKIEQVRDTLAAEGSTEVKERKLIEYPISETQRKKIETSMIEAAMAGGDLIGTLTDLIHSLAEINSSIFEEIGSLAA